MFYLRHPGKMQENTPGYPQNTWQPSWAHMNPFQNSTRPEAYARRKVGPSRWETSKTAGFIGPQNKQWLLGLVA